MKFSIRDLLLVTVIVALALGWVVDHSRQVVRATARDREWLHCTEAILLRLGGASSEPYSVTLPNGDRFNVGEFPNKPLPTSSAPSPDTPKP